MTLEAFMELQRRRITTSVPSVPEEPCLRAHDLERVSIPHRGLRADRLQQRKRCACGRIVLKGRTRCQRCYSEHRRLGPARRA